MHRFMYEQIIKKKRALILKYTSYSKCSDVTTFSKIIILASFEDISEDIWWLLKQFFKIVFLVAIWKKK